MPERILNAATNLSDLTTAKVNQIQNVTKTAKMLAMNALIEASRAGDAGRGFAVVANEVTNISQHITSIANELQELFVVEAAELRKTAQTVRGSRLSDLALYVIELIDRNLYERSCDVRWWATDSAVVQGCVADASDSARKFAGKRLGVILDSYTVYLDLWVADKSGKVVANGRPDRYRAVGIDVSDKEWFRQAMATKSGGEYAVADIENNETLSGKAVATYATAVRADGEEDGEIVGAMGIFFDWEEQAQSIVNSVSLPPEERERTTIMIIDRESKIIASSDHLTRLGEYMVLGHNNEKKGAYLLDDQTIVAHALTPGYETYAGLGWRGVIIQKPASSMAQARAQNAPRRSEDLFQRQRVAV